MNNRAGVAGYERRTGSASVFVATLVGFIVRLVNHFRFDRVFWALIKYATGNDCK